MHNPCLSGQWDGFPLGLGLVVEDKLTEFSCKIGFKGTFGNSCYQNFDVNITS
jgi:hypothetical protein